MPFYRRVAAIVGLKDGNAFIVTIILSANSRQALQAAEPAYQAILRKYTEYRP